MQQILDDILKQYGSFENPRWDFVSISEKANPYKELLRKLQFEFSIEEFTDLNEHVSFAYLLSANKLQWQLYLSMVGKYYVVFRYNKIREYLDAEKPINAKEEALIHDLKNADVISVPETLLNERVQINFSILGIEYPTIYDCLFEQV